MLLPSFRDIPPFAKPFLIQALPPPSLDELMDRRAFFRLSPAPIPPAVTPAHGGRETGSEAFPLQPLDIRVSRGSWGHNANHAKPDFVEFDVLAHGAAVSQEADLGRFTQNADRR